MRWTQALLFAAVLTIQGATITAQAAPLEPVQKPHRSSPVLHRGRVPKPPHEPRHIAIATAPAVAPPPPTSSPPSYPSTSGALTASQVAEYARQAGFPESVIPTMVAIAYRESRFEPGAINASSGACGLTQIYPAQPGCTDPLTNMRLAYEKYQAAGLAPWSM